MDDLSGFVKFDAKTLVPGLLRAELPAGLRHRHIIQLDDGHDLVAGLVFDAVRLGRAAARYTCKNP